MQPRERSGFELRPRSDDTVVDDTVVDDSVVDEIVVNAWASTVDGCLAEAVRAYVATFATVDAARAPQRQVPFHLPPAPDERLLVEIIDEARHAVEGHEIPVSVTALRTPEGGVAGEFGLVAADTVEAFRSAPVAVAPTGVRVDREDGGYVCSAVLQF